VATLTPPPAPRHAPIQSFALRPAAPELPAIQKVVLDAEALFALDSAELTAAGRTALDDFLVRLGQIGPGTIRLIGHADRLGTQAHNQLLSERRAQTVKDYLVSKGIDPLRLLAEGRGETQPVTRTGACDGGRSARVIACLQADRRVAIEVAGTRSIR
jgi:OOP family OmpA-OmpF porin